MAVASRKTGKKLRKKLNKIGKTDRKSRKVLIKVPDNKLNSKNIQLWLRYKKWLIKNERTEETILQYEQVIKHWFKFIYEYQGNVDITTLRENELDDYFQFCKDKGNNVKRIKSRMDYITIFYNFLLKRKVVEENPMDWVVRPTTRQVRESKVKVDKEMTQKHVDKILDHYEKEFKKDDKEVDLQKLQEFAFFCLAIDTLGLGGHLALMDWDMIDWERRTVTNIKSYFNKSSNCLYFGEYTKEVLLKLRRAREVQGIDCEHDCYYVFYYRKRDGEFTRIANGTINKWCRTFGKVVRRVFTYTDIRLSAYVLLQKNAKLKDAQMKKVLDFEKCLKRERATLRSKKERLGLFRNRNLEELLGDNNREV